MLLCMFDTYWGGVFYCMGPASGVADGCIGGRGGGGGDAFTFAATHILRVFGCCMVMSTIGGRDVFGRACARTIVFELTSRALFLLWVYSSTRV